VKKAAVAALICLGVGALGWGLARGAGVAEPPSGGSPPAEVWPAGEDGWPGGEALVAPEPSFPAGFGVRRVHVDAGHGAPDNTGNRSAFCRDEQDFTLALAVDLAERLERTGHFAVSSSRRAGELVPYPARVEAAERAGAEVFVSLHSDVRGSAVPWSPEPGLECPRARTAPGFSVLWSDEGDAALVASRRRLARATAASLGAIGLLPYDGAEYRGLYEGDERPGVFVDRHQPNDRIFVLRRPRMPSVIVETHNAWDDREARRWDEPATRAAFASALAKALVEVLPP
jgi:N-acetylmuramoyl-L-alanine amidase